MSSKIESSTKSNINSESLKQLQRNQSIQQLSQQIERNRTLSNISTNKTVIKVGNQTISRIRLESIKPEKIEEKKVDRKFLKCAITNRTAQFFIKQQTSSSNVVKRVHHGNYYYDKLKEIFQTRPKENLNQKKMCQDALNQIHMIATYSEFIPEVSLQYQNKFSGKLKIAFDLDETLIHSEQVQKNKDYDYQNDEFGVFIRPYCSQLLSELSKLADLFVFTSANQKYAKTIISLLDPENRFFKAHFSRNNCVTLQSRIQIKHLGILTHDLSKIVIIDNSPIFYLAQPHNGIPIAPYFDDKSDQELLKLLNFLTEKIIPSNDVRETIRKFFQYDMFRQFSDGVQAFQILYN